MQCWRIVIGENIDLESSWICKTEEQAISLPRGIGETEFLWHPDEIWPQEFESEERF